MCFLIGVRLCTSYIYRVYSCGREEYRGRLLLPIVIPAFFEIRTTIGWIIDGVFPAIAMTTASISGMLIRVIYPGMITKFTE